MKSFKMGTVFLKTNYARWNLVVEQMEDVEGPGRIISEVLQDGDGIS